MRIYELLAVINPGLDPKDRDALIAEIKQELGDHGMKITEEDVWWERDLSYTIHGSRVGYYIRLMLESADGTGIQTVSASFNLKKNIWRYLFDKQES